MPSKAECAFFLLTSRGRSAMANSSDSLPTATRVADPGIRALYRLENRWQAWLDIEKSF